jgi:hypothetical protein
MDSFFIQGIGNATLYGTPSNNAVHIGSQMDKRQGYLGLYPRENNLSTKQLCRLCRTDEGLGYLGIHDLHSCDVYQHHLSLMLRYAFKQCFHHELRSATVYCTNQWHNKHMLIKWQ